MLLAISGWLTKIVLEKNRITIVKMNNFLFPSVYKIPWSSIQIIRRYPQGIMALASARYGMAYGLKIEFLQNSIVRKIQLNIGVFSNKEKLHSELAQYVGSKMEETPHEMIHRAQLSFLSFWGVYWLIIFIILIYVLMKYSRLIFN